ncbi:MAG: ABC transporter permease [Solirubrobacteraceae bacterium]
MSWRDNIRIAIAGATSNKMRSLLTILGVLIGVGAVIILVAVGTGSSAQVQNNIDRLGTNTLTVISTGRFGGRSTTGTQSSFATLTLADVQQIQKEPDVQSVSPVASTSVTATYNGASDSSTTVTGSTPSYLSASSYTVQAGSAFTSTQVTDRARVAVIGQTVVTDLFGSANPIGRTIELGSSSFEVIGVLASKGSSGGQDQDNVIVAPYTAVQDELTGESASFTELLVQGKSSATLSTAESEVESILATANNTTVADLPFSIINQASLLSTAESTSSTFTVLLAAVAGISLLVGGIGVMNIMLVTVTERTREIGIRKAIGAPKSAILGQFLAEAVLLSLIGGIGGVIFGVVGSQFYIDGVQPVIAPYSIFLALGVSVVVGVFFGFYPANRAASLRPIDALRYE